MLLLPLPWLRGRLCRLRDSGQREVGQHTLHCHERTDYQLLQRGKDRAINRPIAQPLLAQPMLMSSHDLKWVFRHLVWCGAAV